MSKGAKRKKVLLLFPALLVALLVLVGVLLQSGGECLEKLRAGHYDLVLLDDMMPELSGTETLAVIRREHLAEGTPVVALTANAINGAREKYLAQGFDDYLAKPMSTKELTELLRRRLPPEMQETPQEKPAETAPAGPPAPAVEPAAAHAEPEPVSAAPSAAPAAESDAPADGGIDTKLGLMYTGGLEDLYRRVLGMFAQLQPEKAAKIAAFYAAEDWENYTIEVHALKSTALSIGGRALSAQAKALELAAKAVRAPETPEAEREAALAQIRAGQDPLMAAYAALAAEAQQLLADGIASPVEEKPPSDGH